MEAVVYTYVINIMFEPWMHQLSNLSLLQMSHRKFTITFNSFIQVHTYAFVQVFGYTTIVTFLRGLFNDLETLITFPYMGFNKKIIVEAISKFNLAYVETNVTTIFTL